MSEIESKVRFSFPPIVVRYQTVSPVSSSVTLTRSRTFDILQKGTTQFPVRSITKPEPVSLSLDDICFLADRERLSYSAGTRREAVENAQSKTYKFDEYVSSRPHTSASRYINDVRRDAMTPKSIRSEPVPSRANSRIGPTDFDDEDDSVYPINYFTSLPVGRECCEIIGPQVCSECKQSQSRQLGQEMCDQCFPTLRVSHENMTTAAVLQRYLPGLSESDIQDKIAKGEIAKPRLLRKRYAVNNGHIPKKESDKENETADQKNNNNGLLRNTSMFFINIRDLNAKIISGQIHRAVGFSEKVQKQVLKRQETRRKLSTPSKKPEPEQHKQQKERKAKFDPDILLSLSMQTNEPSFFAGKKFEYELPERLPDPIRFADVRDKKHPVVSNKDSHLYGLEEEPEDEEIAGLLE